MYTAFSESLITPPVVEPISATAVFGVGTAISAAVGIAGLGLQIAQYVDLKSTLPAQKELLDYQIKLSKLQLEEYQKRETEEKTPKNFETPTVMRGSVVRPPQVNLQMQQMGAGAAAMRNMGNAAAAARPNRWLNITPTQMTTRNMIHQSQLAYQDLAYIAPPRLLSPAAILPIESPLHPYFIHKYQYRARSACAHVNQPPNMSPSMPRVNLYERIHRNTAK